VIASAASAVLGPRRRMLFNSLEFLAFLVVVLATYSLAIPASRWRARKAFLVVVSYLFYMAWNPAFGLLLLTSTLLDFFLAQWIERTVDRTRRRRLLAVSVVVNLGILAVFKYGNFILDTLTPLLHPLFGDLTRPTLDIVLPVGISFYTFESLSYSIDVYRGQPAYRSLLDFALFLSFFPHLVAGPIVRPGDFLPQLAKAPVADGLRVERALVRIAIGFAKKILFADVLGSYVDVVYAGEPGAPTGLGVILAIYAYAFQIYFDFSGYTDIALGLAQLFGLRLPENFDRPYLSASPREFWQRWHISLSTWLRDYLYVSLGGNRGSTGRTYLNLLLTMVLGGLWHGAAWTFVAWGAFHGGLLALHRAVAGRHGSRAPRTPLWVRQLATFHLVCFGWVLFRSPSLPAVRDLLLRMRPFTSELTPDAARTLFVLALAIVLHRRGSAQRFREGFTRLPAVAQGVSYAVLVILLFVVSPATARFIYFQF